jgi:hypothetical protein
MAGASTFRSMEEEHPPGCARIARGSHIRMSPNVLPHRITRSGC